MAVIPRCPPTIAFVAKGGRSERNFRLHLRCDTVGAVRAPSHIVCMSYTALEPIGGSRFHYPLMISAPCCVP